MVCKEAMESQASNQGQGAHSRERSVGLLDRLLARRMAHVDRSRATPEDYLEMIRRGSEEQPDH